ncbi:acyltransferase 3 [Paraglaciecola sp. T6c]|uniref:acyltransferase family protein n=1 Tax=Pseudoalteromonas atlantica (strain T6c / ATCC BAA-1087) TaxID=3042615 RepID=UPI00005C6364|nr:acyltransferase [Paraglaciecola sp. T6c]ABG39621.1 acyltransferase 3 [Paraglaciecola sp. T6c]
MKLAGLEGLRGIMCVWVVITHTLTIAALPIYKNEGVGMLLANGTYAVGVFILLSGFVIAFLLDSKKEQYGLYIARRALRLFPAYLVCLLLSILILDMSIEFLNQLIFEHPKTANRLELFHDTKDNLTTHSLLHLFMLHGIVTSEFLPSSAYAIMGQAWSLTLEWQFYLIAPLLMYFLNQKNWFFVVAISVLLLILQRELAWVMGHRSFIFANISLFISGILTFRFFKSFRDGIYSKKEYLIKFSILVLLTIVFQIKIGSKLAMIPPLIWWITIVSETVITKNVLLNMVKRINNCRPILFLGKISYSIYCFHMISLYCVGWFFMVVMPISSHVLYASLVIGLSFPITIGVSFLIYSYVEKYFIKVGKGLGVLSADKVVSKTN